MTCILHNIFYKNAKESTLQRAGRTMILHLKPYTIHTANIMERAWDYTTTDLPTQRSTTLH
jgi:hypothetical protein